MMAEKTLQYQATQKGGPFRLVSVPKPTPGPNEIAIALKAVALNPVDWKKLHFGVMIESWPTVLGIDGAGVVDAVGEGVTKFKAGDEVLSCFFGGVGAIKSAAFQEVAIVPEHVAAKKPKNLSFEEAASLPICYLTAMSAVNAALKIPVPFLQDGISTGKQPNCALVLGGSSATGAATIQVLRLALPSCTILATSSPQHHAHLVSLGATKAFDQRSETLVQDIKAASPGTKGVDVIVDAVGSGAQQISIIDSLRADDPREYAQVFTGAEFKVPDNVKRHVVFGQQMLEVPGGRNTMAALEDILAEGKYKISVQVEKVGTGFEAISKGLEQLKEGVSGKKLVISL